MNTKLFVWVMVVLIGMGSYGAAYGNTPTISGHTLGEIEGAGTLCRSTGANCPAPAGSLSCTQTSGPLQDTTSTASCASGYIVTGGGCFFDRETGGWYNAQRSGNGWNCAAHCYGSCNARVRAYATCCKIT